MNAATSPAVPATSLGEPNLTAIAFFFAFIAATLAITYWAARRTRTTEEFFAAGRVISGRQNGLALAGDYMSAASFLGIAGLVSLSGFDGLIYSTGWLVGWPIVLFMIAEPLRNLGKYTFTDVVSFRMRQTPVRISAALGTLAVVTFYLIAQMVGAGNLIKLMFGIPYELAVAVALMFGTAGLPHILMRFYTVPDAKAARQSVFWATGLTGAFFLMTFILGFGAMVLVGREAITHVDKGGNMAAPLLAEVLGGTGLLGFIAAVAFATILAVVAGLTLSGAAALSHDLWVSVHRKGNAPREEQLMVARMATVVLGIVAILLGILFKGQNVAFMVGLAFAVAASGNFPALVLSIFWRGFTTAGAVTSIILGTVSSLTLIAISPTIMVDVFGAPAALFPLKSPAIVTIPLGFAAGIVVSLLSPEQGARAAYDAKERRMIMGVE